MRHHSTRSRRWALLLALAITQCKRRRRPADDLDEILARPRLAQRDTLEDGARDAAAAPESDRGVDRVEGLLVVPAHPEGREPDTNLRFRTHERIEDVPQYHYVWQGPEVPQWMPLSDGAALLSALDPAEDGWFALYRGPANATPAIADRAIAARYHRSGRRVFRFDLGAAVAGRALEITDARLDGAMIYFVRSCHSYAREERSRCGYLSALDVGSGLVRWSTPALTARGFITLITERYLLVGYSFTAERASVSVVRKTDGRVIHRIAVAVNGALALDTPAGPTRALHVVGSGTRTQSLTVRALDSDAPRLSVDGPPTGERGWTLQLGDHD